MQNECNAESSLETLSALLSSRFKLPPVSPEMAHIKVDAEYRFDCSCVFLTFIDWRSEAVFIKLLKNISYLSEISNPDFSIFTCTASMKLCMLMKNKENGWSWEPLLCLRFENGRMNASPGAVFIKLLRKVSNLGHDFKCRFPICFQLYLNEIVHAY